MYCTHCTGTGTGTSTGTGTGTGTCEPELVMASAAGSEVLKHTITLRVRFVSY